LPEREGKTKMKLLLRHPVCTMSEMTSVGWNESFDKLAESLVGAWVFWGGLS
jgi:hypothetical protein